MDEGLEVKSRIGRRGFATTESEGRREGSKPTAVF